MYYIFILFIELESSCITDIRVLVELVLDTEARE